MGLVSLDFGVCCDVCERAKANLELDFTSKYLLLSAFLAASIPVKLDERIFVSGAVQRRRVHKKRPPPKKGSEQLRFHRAAFEMDWMFAIFRRIFCQAF